MDSSFIFVKKYDLLIFIHKNTTKYQLNNLIYKIEGSITK